jgi:taurine-pyruvate aminotransferase
MAKGITSGYMPLGATAATEAVFQAFMGSSAENVHYNSVSTFGGHAGACAAGLANIEIFEREKLWENARDVGGYLMDNLKGLEDLPTVGEVRGKGLLIGIEMAREGKAPLSAAEMKLLRNRLMDEGLILFSIAAPTYSVLGLSPPLILSREEADTIAQTLEKVITQFSGQS